MAVILGDLVILVLSLMAFLPIILMSFTETASLGARNGEDELIEQQLKAASGKYVFLSEASLVMNKRHMSFL